jgi:pyruvate/2-oxoglutarate dehydrogenase complex dihydrolipoamide dehydrogenase (E3) component
MPKYEFDLGVLGGGSAGLTAAAGAARLGAKVLLIEKEAALGGDCLHFGCVPSKTLIRTASVYQAMKTSARFGLPAIEPGPVDFAQVRARIDEVIRAIQQHDSVERFCNLGVRVEFGRPRFLDPHQVELDGKKFTARAWVIATGSSPAAPPVPGLDKTPYLTNREIFSLEKMPASMIVLGGGPVAIEMAQAFQRLGSQVDVVQRSGQILSKEDPDMARGVMEAMEQEGVAFHLESKVLDVKDLGGEPELTLKDKQGAEKTLRAEALLVALGRTANVEGLGLEAAGVDFSPEGVAADSRLRTSQKHIYVAGDATGSYLFTHAAGYEASVVVANAVLRLPRRADYTFLPWCTFTEPELASIGMNEKAAQEAGRPYKVFIQEFKDNDRSLAEGFDIGRIKLLLGERDKPLGVQILGPHAGELLGEWVAALGGRVKLTTLAGAVHPYPTLGEINQRAALNFVEQKYLSARIKKGLKFFFHLKGRACRADEDAGGQKSKKG